MDRVLGSGRAGLMGEEMAALVAECLWGTFAVNRVMSYNVFNSLPLKRALFSINLIFLRLCACLFYLYNILLCSNVGQIFYK